MPSSTLLLEESRGLTILTSGDRGLRTAIGGAKPRGKEARA
ncbi:hypothetical protein COLO4_03841 [Corchorus olitorius]|uniref:Uncharacterized protein n=1 Tax=Corchorus olitorius TaxID=93759 RepID=A0A1R3KWJ4_9ROSI|nr:hypothetical protein COLO4_03841 [Corchorus olitorius]